MYKTVFQADVLEGVPFTSLEEAHFHRQVPMLRKSTCQGTMSALNIAGDFYIAKGNRQPSWPLIYSRHHR